MSKPLPRPTPKSRYSYARVTKEIARELDAKDFGEQKIVAGKAGLDESAFSHRMTGVRSRFTVEQLGCIADHWGKPPGWPFNIIDESIATGPQLMAAERTAEYRKKAPKKK